MVKKWIELRMCISTEKDESEQSAHDGDPRELGLSTLREDNMHQNTPHAEKEDGELALVHSEPPGQGPACESKRWKGFWEKVSKKKTHSSPSR